jgi:hypothetical protein
MNTMIWLKRIHAELTARLNRGKWKILHFPTKSYETFERVNKIQMLEDIKREIMQKTPTGALFQAER